VAELLHEVVSSTSVHLNNRRTSEMRTTEFGYLTISEFVRRNRSYCQ
jgi:hypothetical protein